MYRNRKISTLGVALLATTLLTACGNSNGQSEDSNTSKEDDKTMTIMSPFLEATAPTGDNELQDALEEATGYKMKVNWVPNTNYADKMNITLASDDIPKILVASKTGSFVKSAENDAFWDLTDYLKDYPNLSQANPDVLQNSSVNGKVYGVYRSRDIMRTSVFVRKDWLDELNLEMPETTQDLYDLAKAFTENDPDGNGKDDTTGVVIPSWPGGINSSSPYDALAVWFGAGNAWKEVDGKLEPSFMQPEYLESIQFVKDMVEKGYINSDYATLSADNWDDPILNGKGGIVIDTYSRAASINSKYAQSHPDEEGPFVEFTGNLKNADGQLNAMPTDGYSSFLAIPKQSVKTEEELKVVLDFIDKTNDKEAQILLGNGIEGKNFEVVDDKAQAIKSDEAEKVANLQRCYSQLATNVTTELQYYLSKQDTPEKEAEYQRRLDLMASDEESAVFNPAAAYVADTYVTKGVQLDQIIGDARIQYIAGQIDDNGWEDAIKQWQKQGGNDIMDEMNTLHAEATK